jgi:opacity protein-like surface antigen
MPFRQRLLLLVPLLAVTPARAVETSFGLQAQVFRPIGEFGDLSRLDRKFGFGVGFQVPVDFGSGQVLRPRFDYLDLGRDDSNGRYHSASAILSVDYNHYFEGVREGAYLIGGLGLHSTRRDIRRSFAGKEVTSDGNTTGLYYNVGLGYAFNTNFGVELTYVGLAMPRVDFPAATLPSEPRFTGHGLSAAVSFTF